MGRRGLVLGGVAAVAVACTPDDAQPPQDSPAPPVSPNRLAASKSASSKSASRTAPTSADWQRLARSVSGTLARPGYATYDTVRLIQNPRYDGARPLAVLSVASAQDVATAFAFAQDHGAPGGASGPAGTAIPAGRPATAGGRSLVVDVRPLPGSA